MDRNTLREEGHTLLEEARKEPNPLIQQMLIESARHIFRCFGDSFLQPVPIEVTLGNKTMGDTNIVSGGQVGAVGSNSRAEGNIFNQILLQNAEDIDLPALAAELSTISQKLKDSAARPEDFVALGAVAEAQIAAGKGDGTKALEALSKAGGDALKVAKEIGAGVAAKALQRSQPEVLSDLERTRIIPWARMSHQNFLLELEKLGDIANHQILQNLEQYGICQIRIMAHAADEHVIENVAKLIGPPTDRQNEFVGAIKDIRPQPNVEANTGDSRGDLGFHVDGTQHHDQPAILIFQYATGATLGANSRFADAARIILDIEEERREQLLLNLARPDAATFTKGEGKYVGPIFSYSPTDNLMCRIRFDAVINVHPECKEDFGYLESLFNDDHYAAVFQPRDGDIIVFDNWRVMHARDEVYGTRQRHHRRMWLSLLHPEHQARYNLGIRPIPTGIAARIKEINAA